MATKQDAIALLKKDHAKMRELLEKFAATTDRGIKIRAELLTEIELEIELHAGLEEEIFYPAYRDAAENKEDRKHFFEATEEHAFVRHALAQLKKTPLDTELFGARAKVLKDLIEHHAEEEEDQMFPKARTLLGEDTLVRLGEEIQRRKTQLEPELTAVVHKKR